MIRITVMNFRIDLNLLRVFDAVYETRSVTAAARRLGRTQPAVSNALARLRRAFTDPLFVRTPRGMEPTPAARSLAETVRGALGLLQAGFAARSGFDPTASRRSFQLQMSDIGEVYFLPPLVERLRSEAPGVGVEVVALPLEATAVALAGGELDLAIGFLPGLPPAVRSHRLFLDRYVCLLSAQHRLARRPLDRSGFARAAHALVASPTTGHQVVEEALAREGLLAQVRLRVPHFTVLPLVLERSDLLLVAPLRIARAFARERRLVVRPLPLRLPPADVAVHWHERFERDPGNRWLRELVVQLFGRRPRAQALAARSAA